MKANDIRKKSDVELKQFQTDLIKEQFNLRMQKGTGQLVKPDRVKKVRRDLARIKTIQRQALSV